MRSLKNKKILITGGAGFIGSHLADALKSYTSNITVIDKATGQDLKKFIRSGGLKKNFDFIFHLAGSASVGASIIEPFEDFEANLFNTILLLEDLRSLKKKPLLIFASSAAVYGIPQKMPVSEESPTVPVSPYGASKLAAENYIKVYSKLYHIPAVILRFFSVYGPGQKKQVIYDLIRKIQKNSLNLEVMGSANQLLDLIFIDDLIKAMILAAQKARGEGESYNIATGTSIKMEKIIKTICQVFEVKPKIYYIKESRPGANLKWQVDIGKIKKLGFNRETELINGIIKTKEWFDRNYNG